MKLTDLFESVADLLKGDHFYHSVRNDEDIIKIFQQGLRAGTNVSLDTQGQSFEDEGGTILVFKKSDYTIKLKDYQSDGVVTQGSGKPIAIIKDTSIHTRKGFSAEELEAEWNDLEQQMEKLGKATGKSLEEVKNFSYVMKNKVPDWLTQQQFDRLKRLSKQVDELFVKLDLLGEKDLIPEITSADVLKQYKVHKVPVYELPARFQE